MATKPEVVVENIRLKAELEEYKRMRRERDEEIRQLRALRDEQNQQLARRDDNITSLNKQFNTQAGEINELRINLAKSWDEKTARGVVQLFLREIPAFNR